MNIIIIINKITCINILLFINIDIINYSHMNIYISSCIKIKFRIKIRCNLHISMLQVHNTKWLYETIHYKHMFTLWHSVLYPMAQRAIPYGTACHLTKSILTKSILTKSIYLSIAVMYKNIQF